MKNKTIKFLIIIAILFAFNKSYSQYGVQFNYINPTGTMGYYFKPTFGTELFMKSNEEDNNFVYGASLGFYILNSRLDTFTNYTVKMSNGTTLIPGYRIYSNYYVVSFGINAEYKFLLSNLTPIVGLDASASIHNYDYKEYVETVLDLQSTNEETVEFAIMPKVGVRYELNKNWVFSAGIGKSLGVIINGSGMSYWKTYFNVSIYF